MTAQASYETWRKNLGEDYSPSWEDLAGHEQGVWEEIADEGAMNEAVADAERVSQQWPDGVHTAEELGKTEPGRRPVPPRPGSFEEKAERYPGFSLTGMDDVISPHLREVTVSGAKAIVAAILDGTTQPIRMDGAVVAYVIPAAAVELKFHLRHRHGDDGDDLIAAFRTEATAELFRRLLPEYPGDRYEITELTE